MDIFTELWHDLKSSAQDLITSDSISIWQTPHLETPKNPEHGDISTNIAMILASVGKGNPRETAERLVENFRTISYITKIDIAGPGFINFTLSQEKWKESLKNSDSWHVDIGAGEPVNVEYVSANPTGPMHIGHARGAVYGDALANMLQHCGYRVTKEYYINDAGSQIDTVLDSAFLRYKEIVTGEEIEIPQGLYPGAYLKPVGEKLRQKFGTDLMKLPREEMHKSIKSFVIDEMMSVIKSDLAKLGVKHDIFFSEQSLHDAGKIDKAIELLSNKGLIYNGVLPAPKGKVHETWDKKEQLLFKSSAYGDDQDRPIQKGNGDWTYLAADFAYVQDKIERGFSTLVYILGADHGGYIKRMEAVIDALGEGVVKSDLRISQLVNFIKNGEPLKMSKRQGNFMTVADVVQEVGKDIVRFIMLTRRNDMVLDFDFDRVKEQSKDNPVFYVQYAHVRTNSILAKARESMPQAYSIFESGGEDLSLLSSDAEIGLIKLIAHWPRILASAARAREPQKIAYYLIDLASAFHGLWNLGKENNDYRFTIEGNDELTAARLYLVKATKQMLFKALAIIGVDALEEM